MQLVRSGGLWGALMGVAVLAGCSGGAAGSHDAAARVGGVTITRSQVAHWASIVTLARGSQQSAEAKEQALRLLIDWRWLLGEAAAEGDAPTTAQIDARVKASDASSFPGGQAEAASFMKVSGQTPADLELEAAVQLARESLKRTVVDRTPAVSGAAVADYYAHHKASFVVRELRVIRITNTKHYDQALAVKKRIEQGRFPMAEFPIERRELPVDLSQGARPVLERAIRDATVGRVEGPVRQRAVETVYDYFVFVVESDTPRHLQPLSDVRASIARQLEAQARRVARESFVRAWRARWRAQTSCTPGYVVEGCRQHPSASGSGEPLELP